MSLPDDRDSFSPGARKRVPLAAVIIPWICAVADLVVIGYFKIVKHDSDTADTFGYLMYMLVGFGCATACAWYVLRGAIDPYNDFIRDLRRGLRHIRDGALRDGYELALADMRNAPFAIGQRPRFGAPPASAQDSTVTGEDQRPGLTGTDGPTNR